MRSVIHVGEPMSAELRSIMTRLTMDMPAIAASPPQALA